MIKLVQIRDALRGAHMLEYRLSGDLTEVSLRRVTKGSWQ
jgi:hypothetical protein